LLEDAGEISEILGRSYATPDGVEEEDLEAELACLGDELEAIDAEETPAYLSPPASSTTSAAPASQFSCPEQPTSAISGRAMPIVANP